jgi:hypothetical protein
VALVEEGLQHRQLRIAAVIALQGREVEVRVDEGGPRRDGGIEAGPRVVEVSLGAEDGAQVVLRFGVARVDGDGGGIGFLCRVRVALRFQQRAQIVEGQIVLGVDRGGAAVADDRLFALAAGRQRHAQIVPSAGVIAVEYRRPPAGGHGVV